MTRIRVIGDVHGKWKRYRTLTRDVPYSLQVGDFGFKMEHERHMRFRDSQRHKIVFGNHDDTTYLNAPHSMGDSGIWHGIFCMRGAFSIDRNRRIEGLDWWPNEQMSYAEMASAMDSYEKYQPDVVVTHDCPDFLYPQMGYLPSKLSYTPQFLTHCFEIHQPRMWIYGHHHRSNTSHIKGTTFICLDELEYIDIEV